MSEIELAVTTGVLAFAQGANEDQRQIALTSPSADIAPLLRSATAQRQVKLKLSGQITLMVGDTSAIWFVHNKRSAEDFDNLYTFLAHYPSRRMRFLCEVVE